MKNINSTIKELSEALDGDSLLLGQGISLKYSADWSETTPCSPIAVVKPKTIEDLSTVLATCHANDQSIVVQGGLTGLAGGATPRSNEIAISLERLVGILEIDTSSMTITALAGTPLEVLQDAAAEHNLMVPLDLGARGSCTIGGNISTNAGGTEVIRYGMTRAMVLGLEAVLADGTVISSMNKMIKNNSGYDLKQLFIGTEGTLGIVCNCVLQLQPKLSDTQTAIVGLKSYDQVVELLNLLKSDLAQGLTAFELMWHDYYHKILQLLPDLRNPIDTTEPFYLLLEYQSNDQSNGKELFESTLARYMETGLIENAAIAQNGRDAEAFWNIREGVSELLQIYAIRSNQDVSMPIASIGEFASELENDLMLSFPNIEIFLFGHIGDSNIHIIASNKSEDDCAKITKLIMQKVQQYEGSISAEHGIGILKKAYLDYSRTEAEIQLMKTLKSALDPKNILNPGRVF